MARTGSSSSAAIYIDDQLAQAKEYVRTSVVTEEEWAFVEAAIRRTVFLELARQASAEIRTPITSIRGYTDLLLHGQFGPVTEEQIRILSIIAGNAQRLAELFSTIRFEQKSS
jgi:signal transduction histidine kinase